MKKTLDKDREQEKTRKKQRNEEYSKREAHNANNRRSMAARRARDNDFREQENISLRQRVEDLRKSRTQSLQVCMKNFFDEIKELPEYVCSCCGCLYFKSQVSNTTEEDLKTLKFPEKRIPKIFWYEQDVPKLCANCKRSIKKKLVPRMALENGLHFPIVPPELEGLRRLEQRLLSPRIPFLNIKAWPVGGQAYMRGNIVNVEADLDVSGKVLPKSFDESAVVQVKLMRHMKFKHPYLHDMVRPYKLHQAAQYLVGTTLFRKEGIILSNDWGGHEPDDTVPFPLDDGEKEEESDQEQIVTTEEHVEDEEEQTAHETLVYNENPWAVAVAPAQGQIPIPLHADLNAEVLSFPSIYCGEERTITRDGPKTYTEIAKSEIMRHDRRCSNPEKIFFSYKKSYNEKVKNQCYIVLRKHRAGKNINAKFARNDEMIQELLDNDEGYEVFKNIRSCPAYWQAESKKLVAMIRQLGKPTFFITLSAAETKWSELLVSLSKIVDGKAITEEEAENLTKEEKERLINSDSPICVKMFDHRFRAFLKHILKSKSGVFQSNSIQDHYFRMEFQMRGSPHMHGLLFNQDTPVFLPGDMDSEKRCTEFIDQYITCEREEEGEVGQYIAYQIHKHSRTCYKKKFGKEEPSCRFGFPRPPLLITRILLPLTQDVSTAEAKKARENYKIIRSRLTEMGRSYTDILPFEDFLRDIKISEEEYITALRSSLKREQVFLKRRTCDIYVNNYNATLLKTWRANMDLQFVINPYGAAKYVASYISKSDTGVSRLLELASLQIQKGNLTVRERIRKYANVLCGGTEISIQEACAFLLSIPNIHSTRTDIFVNTSEKHERTRMLKTKQQLEKMEDNSEDIYQSGVIEHYCNRPNQLESTCLAEFATFYNYQSGKPGEVNVDTEAESSEAESEAESSPFIQSRQSLPMRRGYGSVKRRKIQKILRYRHYGQAQDENNYLREKIMLYVPWRSEDKDILSNNMQEVAANNADLISENEKSYHAPMDCLSFKDVFKSITVDSDDEDGIDTEVISNNMRLIEEENYFGNDFEAQGSQNQARSASFLPPRFLPNTEYINLMRSLNKEQRRFVYHVLHCVKNGEIIYEFLSGAGGTGKSQALKAIVQSLVRYFQHNQDFDPQYTCVILAAPTGKAAYNVYGVTLHHAFKLPANQKPGPLIPLQDSEVNKLRIQLRYVKVFLIDEVSMVSVKMFYDINIRMKQIFQTDQDFGARSVIFFGDLLQISPTFGSYIFTDPTHMSLGKITGNYLWEKFRYFELTQIMRQAGEYEFIKALRNLSLGTMDEDDIALMRSREISETNQPHPNAIWLFTTNASCEAHNRRVHDTMEGFGINAMAYDQIEGKGYLKQKESLLRKAKALTRQQQDGLPYSTYLKVGGEYFVSTNIDVPDGLFNGSTGTIRYIEMGRTETEEVAKRVWVDFHDPLIGVSQKARLHYKKPAHVDGNCIAIERIQRRLSYGGYAGLRIIREQFPLVPANGMTIHKSQGSTMPLVVLNVQEDQNRKIPRSLLYVGASRASSRYGFWINGKFEPPNEPDENDLAIREIQRLKKERQMLFSIKFLDDYDEGYFKLYFQNIGSFLPHQQDLESDESIMASDIIAIIEPHLLPTDEINMKGFRVKQRINCRHQRNSEGVLILTKSSQLETHAAVTEIEENSHYIIQPLRITTTQILVVYKHPKFPESKFLIGLSEEISKINGNLIIVGDINMDLLKDNGKKLIHLMEKNGLHSMMQIGKPSTDGGSQIDVCFSNRGAAEVWYYESYFSYHKPICVAWKK